MGHDVHFLMRLDRLSLPHVELAMSLYNDTPMVRFILDSLNLPERVERIALALGDEADGPVLVVHRDGHFITCLGAGMSPVGLEVVPRSRLDALAQRQHELRERMEMARQHTGSRGRAYGLFRPLLVSGACLSREEFVAASALAPILQGEILDIIISLHKDLRVAAHELRNQRRRRTASPALLRAYWDAVWGIGHLTLLLGMEGRPLVEAVSTSPELVPTDLMISWPAVRQGLSPVALRGAWAAGKLGKLVLSSYKAGYHRGGSDLAYYSVVLSLFAIAGRHKGLRGEIRKAFQRGISTEEREVCGFLFEKAPPLMLELYDMLMSHADDDPRVLAVYAQSMYSKCMTPMFPSGSPHHYEDPLEVPQELAIPTAAMLPFRLVGDSQALPITLALTTLISRLDAEALYFPRSFLQEFNFPFRPKLVTELIEKEEALYGPREPVTAEARPGRNDPCPCGTGKKYKKCCAQIEA